MVMSGWRYWKTWLPLKNRYRMVRFTYQRGYRKPDLQIPPFQRGRGPLTLGVRLEEFDDL